MADDIRETSAHHVRLVLDNDQGTYNDVRDLIAEVLDSETPSVDLGDSLRDYVEMLCGLGEDNEPTMMARELLGVVICSVDWTMVASEYLSDDYRMKAVRHAQRDYGLIVAAVNQILPTFHDADSTVIVDGSMFSPSWRALAGGAAVWSLDDVDDATEHYVHTLDALVDDYTDPTRGGSLGWSDGCLWFYGADHDGEDF